MSALGQHIVAELYGISGEALNDPALLERTMMEASQFAGATVVESSFNPFAPHGVTGIIVIQESHLAIHTWPEHGYAALDVFTCSTDIDPASIIDDIARVLEADKCEKQRLYRGQDAPPAAPLSKSHGAMRRSVWLTDRQDDIALSLRHADVLFQEKSAYQKVEVVQSYGYGKMLLLDGQVAFTEKDEFAYHEMISHVPALHHPAPATALIIGGGDGGACREFLKHPAIDQITVVEIDPTVTEASRDHFPEMAACLDNDRVTLIHGDGHGFLKSHSEPFDLIVVDSLDTSGEVPFDDDFHSQVQAALKENGLYVLQTVAPTVSPDQFKAAVKSVAGAFSTVSPYLAFLPTYSTGMLSFVLAGEQLSAPRSANHLKPLRYVNDGVIAGALCLPTFVQNLIKE